MTVDELAAAIRSYVGPQPSPATRDVPTWYIDIDSMASDEDIRNLASDILDALGQRDRQQQPSEPADPRTKQP